MTNPLFELIFTAEAEVTRSAEADPAEDDE